MACPSIESFLHSDWHYRAEGNASLVIFNPKTRTVLKIRKRCTLKDSAQKVVGKNLQSCHGFIRTAIEPLLGVEYVGVSKMVLVTKEFLESLAQHFQDQRPEKRHHTEVDFTKSHILDLPDYCFLQYPTKVQSDTCSPTFCVEIKPKRGFLPVSCHVPDDLSIKYSVCRYCLLQQYKVQHFVWEKRSHFCPLDLFSCDPPRMKYCLNMLLENPQNNLRIFKDGVAIYQAKEKSTPSLADQQELLEHLGQYFGESCAEERKDDPLQSSCVQSLQDVVIQALLSTTNARNGIKLMNGRRPWYSHQTCMESGYSNCPKEKYPTNVNMEASDKCILRRLLTAQSLSLLEIDIILPLYQKVLLYLEDHPEDSEKYRLDFPYEEDFSVLNNETVSHLNALEDVRNGGKLDVSSVGIKDAVKLIRDYLITRTLKDCSIMLAMQPVSEDDSSPVPCGVPLVRTIQGRSYVYSATVVDLDPKPSTRIPMYESLDRDVAREYVARHRNGVVK